MKLFLYTITFLLLITYANSQSVPPSQTHNTLQAATPTTPSSPDTSDVVEMRADLQRLQVLLNQMRNNLAFVQTSQTPLKHQFELEADAWQVIVDQMDRRLKHMEQQRGKE